MIFYLHEKNICFVTYKIQFNIHLMSSFFSRVLWFWLYINCFWLTLHKLCIYSYIFINDFQFFSNNKLDLKYVYNLYLPTPTTSWVRSIVIYMDEKNLFRSKKMSLRWWQEFLRWKNWYLFLDTSSFDKVWDKSLRV